MNYTPNFNLSKPEPDDFYDIGNENSNMDIIDAELAKASDITQYDTDGVQRIRYGTVTLTDKNGQTYTQNQEAKYKIKGGVCTLSMNVLVYDIDADRTAGEWVAPSGSIVPVPVEPLGGDYLNNHSSCFVNSQSNNSKQVLFSGSLIAPGRVRLTSLAVLGSNTTFSATFEFVFPVAGMVTIA